MLRFRSSRHPHEVLFVVASLIVGLAGILAYDDAASPTVKTFGPAFGLTLYGAILVTSIVALAGILFLNEKGGIIERAGLFGLGLMLFVYGLVVIFKVGADGTTVSMWSWAMAGANLWRCYQIGLEIDELQAVRNALKESSDRER